MLPFGKCFLFRSLQRAGVSLSEQAGSTSSWEEPCETSLFGVGAPPCPWPQVCFLSSSAAWWTPSTKKGTSQRDSALGKRHGHDSGWGQRAAEKWLFLTIRLKLPRVLKHPWQSSMPLLLLLFSARGPIGAKAKGSQLSHRLRLGQAPVTPSSPF